MRSVARSPKLHGGLGLGEPDEPFALGLVLGARCVTSAARVMLAVDVESENPCMNIAFSV